MLLARLGRDRRFPACDVGFARGERPIFVISKLGRGLGVAVALLASVGCSSPRRSAGPTPGFYSQPGPSGGLPTLDRQVTVGSAFTPFGVLFDQLPKIVFPLPPLPSSQGSEPSSSGGWALPWPSGQLPFPWPGPAPQPAPQPDTPSDEWPAAWSAWEDEVLARTNDTRARGVVCGGQSMPPAPPVGPNGALRAAARGHSRDMATRNYFEHDTPEGAGPGARARAAGFSSSFVGENIAAGQTDPQRVVQAWIDSPGHCVNMMDPRYKVLGVGYFYEGGGDRFNHYWTQDFGG
jgi:uncharacterized protein YkwD